MSSVLYVNGRFINHIDELKNIFSQKIEPTSALADEIHDAYCSGAFHSWLEGSSLPEDQHFLALLPRNTDISNSELLTELSKIFANKTDVVNKPCFGKFAQFRRLMYGMSDGKWKTIESKDAISPANGKRHHLKAQITLLEKINESYTVDLVLVCAENGQIRDVLSRKIITLNTDDKELYVEFDPFIAPEGIKEKYVLDLLIEGERKIRIPITESWDKSLKMVLVKGKEDFLMGAQGTEPKKPNFAVEASFVQAHPLEKVSVKTFYISKYPVTLRLWNDIMGIYVLNEMSADNPVANVTYNEVQEFIKRLNHRTGRSYRLPTEYEWEYAARGGRESKNYRFSGSDNIKEVAWFKDPNKPKDCVSPIGQKKANELGLFDMSGNVWEWCDTPFSSSLGSIKEVDRTRRVVRGGSYTTTEKMCIVYCRDSKRLDNSSSNVGFRLAMNV